MQQEKGKNQKSGCGCKNRVKPGDIKGKIEVKDTRKRKDGPGGN